MVQTLMKCCIIMQQFIWVFTVCQSVYKGLIQSHGKISYDQMLLLLQLNLINSKSSGLEVLFQIVSSSNFMEVDIKIYNPHK